MKPKNILIIVTLLAIILIGAACSLTRKEEPEVIGMANPASVYCEDQGGRLEIRTSKDGGQYGMCLFDDGSECDEWAFYQEKCSPGEFFPQPEVEEELVEGNFVEDTALSMQVTAIYGQVVSPAEKGPADALLLLVSEDIPEMFVTGETGEIEDMIQSLKDKSEPANKANFWGWLDCPSMDKCLLTVSKMRVDGPGDELPTDKIEGWEGIIYSGPSGIRSGGDDYIAVLGEYPFEYGIWSMDKSINQQLEELRDSGKVVRIWGDLYAGRPDWNATQIVVTQVEFAETD